MHGHAFHAHDVMLHDENGRLRARGSLELPSGANDLVARGSFRLYQPVPEGRYRLTVANGLSADVVLTKRAGGYSLMLN
jgi:hypothetical protein